MQVNSPSFPPGCCIDPNTVDPPDVNGIYDNTFSLVNCGDLVLNTPNPDPNFCSALNGNPHSNAITFIISDIFGSGDPIDQIFLNNNITVGNAVDVCFTSEKVLNFDPLRLITGINIIDDMLK